MLKDYSRKKDKKLILVVILFGFAIGLVVFNYYVSKQNIFKLLIDSGIDYFCDIITSGKTISGEFTLDINSSYDISNNNLFDIIKELDIYGNYGINFKNKIVNMDVNTNYKNNKLLNFNIYGEDDKGYIYLEDLYDKYIKFNLNDYNKIIQNVNSEDVKIVLSSVFLALNKALKDEYFIKEKVNFDRKRVTKISLVLDSNNIKVIISDLVKSLLNNEEFLDSYANIIGGDVNKVKDKLSSLLDKKYDDFKTINISIYSKNIKFLKFEIVYDNNIYAFKVNDKNSLFKKDNDIQMIFEIIDQDNNLLEINFSSTIKYGDKIEKPDITNSVDYRKVEMNKIYFKLLGQRGIWDFVTDLGKFKIGYDLSGKTLL